MQRNQPKKKKFLQKINLLKKQTCLGTNKGMFQKEETKGLSESEFKNMLQI